MSASAARSCPATGWSSLRKSCSSASGAMIRCRFQCYVSEQVVCEGQIRGIPIPVAVLTAKA